MLIFLVLKYIAWALKISLRAFTVLSSIIRDINLRIMRIIGISSKIMFLASKTIVHETFIYPKSNCNEYSLCM